MAEENKENSKSEKLKSMKRKSTAANSEEDDVMILDLGDDNIKNIEKKSQNIDNQFATMGLNDNPKREENPFSFKHFLKGDSNNYQSQGARPKVYANTTHSTLDNHGTTENHQSRVTPEFSSALPDFVQDHLVIEQCYLGTSASPQDITVDLENLPDFTLNRNSSSMWHDARVNERRTNNTPSNLPLDLPTRPRVGFPLDLPLTESQALGNRNSQTTEVGVSKSLPDFLSDGAVYSQPEDVNKVEQSPEREIERLRRDLELCRRQLAEQNRRADQLQRQLEESHNKEQDYTHNLTKALEQVEENLNISTRRAISAENTVLRLRQQNKQLTMEVTQLKKENRDLKLDEGATGGTKLKNNDRQTHRFAQELRTAANTAECSLRQLLNGVDNLRMMASSLENMQRIEDHSDKFLSDVDDDTGPAL